MSTVEKGRKPVESTPGCRFEIHIHNPQQVNIYNNCGPAGPGPSTPAEECPPPPVAEGACVPLALGAKPKQSRQRKLEKLLQRNRVPSALGAATFHLIRRFLAGRAPANALEVSAFETLSAMPPEIRRIFSCALDSFDSLPPGDRDQLFQPGLAEDIDTPIDPDTLGEVIGEEIAGRASQEIFGDPAAVEAERPGRNRFFEPEGEFFDVQLRVCRVNGLRTNEFKPPLGPGDYEPAELQQRCEPVLVGEEIQLNCENQIGNCPGNFLTGDICLRVPEVEAGQGVVLEGVNYISVDAKVRLTAQPPGTQTRDVEAHVFGDLDTPLNEVVDGQEVLIRDCRVHDRIAFQVPADLPPGIYSLQIVMPNVTGIPKLGDPILSNPQFLNVIPPSTARFQIAIDRLTARQETSPASFGSDEVGFNVVAAALLADGTTGPLQVLKRSDGREGLRFGDVDSGDGFPLNSVLFSHQQPILGMAMSVTGYEIDSEDAFEKQIEDSTAIFVDLLEKEWKFAAAAIAAAGGYKALAGLGVWGFIALGAATALTLVIDLIIAGWAPADPIILDAIGLTSVDLAAITSANFPSPAELEFQATDDIKVKVTPLEKLPNQFSERREYRSEDEDSRYEINLRYNRIA